MTSATPDDRQRISIREKFVSIHGEATMGLACDEWRGRIMSVGYGAFDIHNDNTKSGSSVIYAHRASYSLYKGEIPKGLFVCHSCDNKKCVNPDHLWVGTNGDNVRDAFAKGINHHGERHYNSTLTDDEVRWIRRLNNHGIGVCFIAELKGVWPSQISKIVNRKQWKRIS